MKTLATVSAFLLLACGGNAPKPAPIQPTDPVAEPAPSPNPITDEELGVSPSPAQPLDEVATPAEPTDAEPTAPAAPVEPVTVLPTSAVADLTMVKGGAAVGTITFQLSGTQVTMSGEFTGLPPGPHAFYIHDGSSCDKPGKHLDPTSSKHGPPASPTRHAGDLGDLVVDEAGNATFSMVTDSVTMEPGRADSIVERAIVIHAKKDDKKGDGGAALACGVIRLR